MPLGESAGRIIEFAQTGAGPDLLLLHSLLTDLTVFELVLPRLARNHQVTRINLPGFGASGVAALETVAEHADHVAHAMDSLALPPATDVFGNGFGAFVALELASRHGKRFGRLIVADALCSFPEPAKAPFRTMAQRVRALGMAAVLDTAVERMFPPSFRDAHPELIATRKSALGAVDAECFARACLALAELDLRPRLEEIRNSTLVLCGELDQTTPPALAEALAKAVRGARYRPIPGSGHCPMLEQPETLTALMEEFLSSEQGGGRS